MIEIKQILIWANELQIESNKSHCDYYFDDIMNYIGLDNLLEINDDTQIAIELKSVIDKKHYDKLVACQTKDELKEWLYAIVSYINKYTEIERIIAEYFEC